MPESPEVSYLSSYISSFCKNKPLTSIQILKGRYLKHGPPENFKAFTTQLPLKLTDVQKKGKVLFLYFENDLCIISKLGLTGWWYVNDDAPTWKPTTPNLKFTFPNNLNLYYTDTLSYGTLTITNNPQDIQKQLNSLAEDIETISLKTLLQNIESKPRLQDKLIEDTIIEQDGYVSGIGNYLKSEILYDAKISPLRQTKDLSNDDWKQVLKSARKVIKKITKAMNDEHAYMETMNVYQRDYDKKGNKIHKHKTKSGRTTFWVPEIQV